MGRTHLESARTIAELKTRIKTCKHYKKHIKNYHKKLKRKLKRKRIDKLQYKRLLNKKRKGRTTQEWFEFYDSHAKDCKKRIKEHKKEHRKKKIRHIKHKTLHIIIPAFFLLILFSFLVFLMFYIRPTITGLIIKTQQQEFSQIINLEFTESADYEWELENLGQLVSVKLSGSIEEKSTESQIKIYLEDLLIFDSSNLPENKESKTKTAPEKTKTSPITGLAVAEESIESNAESEQENPKQKPYSEENTTQINQQEQEAPQILRNESPSQKEPLASENITESTAATSKKTQVEISENIITKQFTDICEQTCDLSQLNLNKSSYTLRIQITNAKLNLNEIIYEIITKIERAEEIPEIEEKIQLKAEIGKPVKWKTKIKAKDIEDIQQKLPPEALIISGQEIEKELFEVEYETPAPQALEEQIPRGKRIKVIGPETIHYKDVLAFTTLPENLNIQNPSHIRIHWIEQDTYISIEKIEDKDDNGIYDYIEWLVPELSEATFEIIIITKAEHLDGDRNFISDIYEQVKALDDVWSEAINNNEYVRVTFYSPLDNTRDITIYPRVVSGNPKIEVYEINGTKLIAEFSSLNSNEYNKVYLTNLISESQDIFDLKIVGGSIEINHIIDPLYQYYLIGGHVTGSGGTGTLNTQQGSNTARWTTSGATDAFTWTNQYPSGTTIDAQTYTVGFWCNTTQTGVGGSRNQIDELHVYDCGASPTCATQDVEFCSVTIQNIDCLVATPTYRTISCSDASSRTLGPGDYIGVRLVADVATNKEPILLLYFNSTTYPSYVNITETPSDDEYPLFNTFTDHLDNNSKYYPGVTQLNTTLQSTNGTVGIQFNSVNYSMSNFSATPTIFNKTFANVGVGTWTYYFFAWGNGTDKNYNITAMRTYVVTINTTGNIITPLLNGVNDNLVVTYPQQINASYTGTNFSAVGIKINGTTINIGENYTWGAGGWEVNYSIPSSQNYSAYTTYLNLTINKAGSNVTIYLNHTQENVTITAGDSIWLNATLITGDDGNIYLYNNDTLINNMSGATSTNATNLTTFNTPGMYNITAYYTGSQNYSKNWSLSWWVNVTEVTNTAPQIIQILNNSIADVDLNEGPSMTNISINFSVYDTQGASDLNSATASINLTKTSEALRYNYTCSQSQADGNYANYSCSVMMWWWDDDGVWIINASIDDTPGLSARNDTLSATIKPLTGFSLGPSILLWGIISPGSKNQTPSSFIILNNTGNQDIIAGNIDVNSTHLMGEINNLIGLYSGNFTVSNNSEGTSECDLSGGTASRMNLTSGAGWNIVAGANLSRGNYTKSDGTAQEQLYFCLTYAGTELTSQAYSTYQEGVWTIRILLAVISTKAVSRITRKKKKEKRKEKEIKLENDNLLQTLNLIIDELKQKYSLDDAETMKLVMQRLKEKYQLNENKVFEILNMKQKENIPATIFNEKLGALESLCKYMKENLNMNYREISKLLNRNERTIWTAYHKATEKQKEPIKVKQTNIFIPVSIFKNRKLTVLESAIIYLKSKELKHTEIARLIERDQRNISTIYSRAVRKIKKSSKDSKKK